MSYGARTEKPQYEGNDGENKLTIKSRDRGEIEMLMNQQREELLKLQETIGMLDDRLTGVLGPHRPTDSRGMTDDSPERSPIAMMIDEHNDRIRGTVWQLHTLLDRIEL